MLGAKTLHTIDASNFEGATHVHDLNQPVPASWKESPDVVRDIGTLAHVFNFPVAMRHRLERVKLGGHFFAHTSEACVSHSDPGILAKRFNHQGHHSLLGRIFRPWLRP